MNEINEKLEKLKVGSCTKKSIRDDVSKGTMIFSEESRRAIYEMGNMESIDLKQTLATVQCSSCLKHVLESGNMHQCGVWLRPNESTMERIRAALKNPYSRATRILSRGRKVDTIHGRQIVPTPWMHEEEQRKTAAHFLYTDLPACQVVRGWTEEYVKYLDHISRIDFSYEAPYKQRNRYENTLFMSSGDSNKQAGPLCQRPDYKSSANALISIQ